MSPATVPVAETLATPELLVAAVCVAPVAASVNVTVTPEMAGDRVAVSVVEVTPVVVEPGVAATRANEVVNCVIFNVSVAVAVA